MNKWLRYFIYAILIFIIAYVGNNSLNNILNEQQHTFVFRPHLINFVMLLTYGGVGVVLGVETLFAEIKKQGKWKFNIPKLIFFGLPSVVFSFILDFYIFANGFSNFPILGDLIMALYSDRICVAIAQLILGYTLITCLYKEIEE